MKKLVALVAIPLAALSLSACGADKPSKEDVTKGMTKLVSGQMPSGSVTDEQLNMITSCVTDKVYDDLSADEATKIAEADASAEMSQDTGKTILEASTECGKELVEKLTK